MQSSCPRATFVIRSLSFMLVLLAAAKFSTAIYKPADERKPATPNPNTDVVKKQIKLVHVDSGKILGMDDDSVEGGIQAVLYSDDKQHASTNWTSVADGDAVKLFNAHSGKVLDVYLGKKDADTPIIQWDDKAAIENGAQNPGGLQNQLWVWEGSGKERRLKSKWSDMVLDVDSEGRVVQRTADTNARSQLWRVAELTETVRPDHLLAAGPAPDAKQRAIIHLANGDFAAGELSESENPSVIRWQTSIATKPFDFNLPAVGAVHFPMQKEVPKAAGDFCIELVGGDMLFGSPISLTADELFVDCGSVGKLHIKRTSISRLIRWGKTADVVYFGPNGLVGWQEPAKNNLWRDEGGVLTTDKPSASIFGNVNLPPLALIEIELALEEQRRFRAGTRGRQRR